jgi:hypothetical protein
VARLCRRVRRWKSQPFGRGVRVYVSESCFAIVLSTRRGYVYKCACLPFMSGCGLDQRQEIADTLWELRAMKKKSRAGSLAGALHASPDLLKGHYPNLAEWMTSAHYDDGEKREGPTLTLWCAGGQWKLTLKDRAEGLVMWLSSEKLLELLQLAETLCMEDEGPWRVDDYSSNHGKRKKTLG